MESENLKEWKRVRNIQDSLPLPPKAPAQIRHTKKESLQCSTPLKGSPQLTGTQTVALQQRTEAFWFLFLSFLLHWIELAAFRGLFQPCHSAQIHNPEVINLPGHRIFWGAKTIAKKSLFLILKNIKFSILKQTYFKPFLIKIQRNTVWKEMKRASHLTVHSERLYIKC